MVQYQRERERERERKKLKKYYYPLRDILKLFYYNQQKILAEKSSTNRHMEQAHFLTSLPSFMTNMKWCPTCQDTTKSQAVKI